MASDYSGIGDNEAGRAKRSKSLAVPPHSVALEAVNPYDGKTWTLWVRDRTLSIVARPKLIGRVYELTKTVRYALLHPTGVWEGVKAYDTEEGEPDWLAYASLPPCSYDYRSGAERDPPDGEVFLVLVDGDRIIPPFWGWVDADENNPLLPADHDAGRFVRNLI